MKRITVLVATLAMTLGMMAGPAAADPVVRHTPGLDGAHPHHVHTGNGGCVDINSVYFLPDHTRGLHGGSEASNGHMQGPFHGTCANEPPPMM